MVVAIAGVRSENKQAFVGFPVVNPIYAISDRTFFSERFGGALYFGGADVSEWEGRGEGA
jgi:hypothetical protein